MKLEKWVLEKNSIQKIPLSTNSNCALKGYEKAYISSMISRHEATTPRLIHKITHTSEAILQNYGTNFARQINKRISELFRELERCKQFTRTKLTSKGILIGEIAMKHHMEDYILAYFHERFPSFIICLYNTYRKETISISEEGEIFTYTASLEDTVNFLSKNRLDQPFFDDISESNEALFEEFYASQFIPSRENRKYFKKMIPESCMKLPGMKGGAEARFRNKNLDKFLT